MYDFATRKRLARQYADPAHIPAYRMMLSTLKLPSSGRIGFNPRQLAEEFLYTLLGHCSIEEVQARTAPTAPVPAAPAESITPAVPAVRAASGAGSKVNKMDEYPGINWRDMDNPLVRMADSIFSDRINCWRILHDLEAKTLEDSADREVLASIVETAIRSELCFQELRHFNDKGEFIGKHPFIAHKDEREEALHLLRTDPEAFFKARKNIELNIARYSSMAKSKKATEETRGQAQKNHELYMAKLQMYRELFADFVRGK